ncbi:MAG: TIGR00269 family protein [Candidatus Diapherotrites archaeon]|nr:TIGR00269 family protein [Candidatus Diapherotrites archaeon]
MKTKKKKKEQKNKSGLKIEEKKKIKCVYCNKDADIILKYGPHRFCKEHFCYFFEKRVRRTIRMNKLIEGREKIAVALSGGKDSITVLYILNKIFGKSNEIVAIIVDEGIGEYRNRAIKAAIESCKNFGIDYELISMKKYYGISTKEVALSLKGDLQKTCNYCGIIRRKIINQKALEIGAKKLATGHNLDDECQSILMNICSKDIPRLLRLGPIAGVKRIESFVPRIKPLYECPEEEVELFAKINKLKYFSKKCPYGIESKRNYFRKFVNYLEEKMPGIRFSIIASLKEIKNLIRLEKEESFKICQICGNPSNEDICKSCEKLNKLKELLKIN